jgi:hypothetical protein
MCQALLKYLAFILEVKKVLGNHREGRSMLINLPPGSSEDLFSQENPPYQGWYGTLGVGIYHQHML